MEEVVARAMKNSMKAAVQEVRAEDRDEVLAELVKIAMTNTMRVVMADGMGEFTDKDRGEGMEQIIEDAMDQAMAELK